MSPLAWSVSKMALALSYAVLLGGAFWLGVWVGTR